MVSAQFLNVGVLTTRKNNRTKLRLRQTKLTLRLNENCFGRGDVTFSWENLHFFTGTVMEYEDFNYVC